MKVTMNTLLKDGAIYTPQGDEQRTIYYPNKEKFLLRVSGKVVGSIHLLTSRYVAEAAEFVIADEAGDHIRTINDEVDVDLFQRM